jgi:hypothetical protein
MPTTTFHQHKAAFFFCGFFLLLCALLARSAPLSHASPTEFKVLEIVFDPIIEAQGGARLTQLKAWTQPSSVDVQYAADIQTASHA